MRLSWCKPVLQRQTDGLRQAPKSLPGRLLQDKTICMLEVPMTAVQTLQLTAAVLTLAAVLLQIFHR